MKEKNKISRNISLDVLKIILVGMVVMLHITNGKMGLTSVEVTQFSGIYWITLILRRCSIVAVNGFVLITGYFMSTSKRINYSKIVSLWLQVFMYSVGIYLILCISGTERVGFGLKELFRQSLPMMTDQYWFMTDYALLLVVAPFLNQLIDGMDQADYQKILRTLILVLSVVPSINIYMDSFGVNGGYSWIWFCVLYLTAGYIRRYSLPKLPYGLIYIVVCGLLVCIGALADYSNNTLFVMMDGISLNYNHILVFLASVCLFCSVLSWKINLGAKLQTFVVGVSKLSLGVYLFHEHSKFRDALWQDIVRIERADDNVLKFLAYIVIVLVGIFTAGILIEWIRSTICEAVFKTIKRISKKNAVVHN